MQSIDEKWYLAVLVIASQVDDNVIESPLLDLQYRLVRAANPEAAYNRAIELGGQESQEYLNEAGNRVSWSFAGLHNLVEINATTLEDGVEVYSKLERNSPERFVLPKNRLATFWSSANEHRTAREILEDNRT
jgi:Domain of unknown function (DUF4288)